MKGKICLCFIHLILVCSFELAQGEDVYGGFTYDNMIRGYLLHIPPSYDGMTPMPLVINLHYYGGNGYYQSLASGMSPKADTEGFLVVYPNALGYPSSWKPSDVDFISVLIDTLGRTYNLDTSRIYATGYSNGGFMAHYLGCKLSQRIAAVAPVSGGFLTTNWEGLKPPRPVPSIHFHARDDEAVPYEGDAFTPGVEDVIASWAQANGCDCGPDSLKNSEGALRQRWSSTLENTEVILWTTDDGGHTWPGASGGSQAVSANDEMWKFFVMHPLHPGTPEVRENQTSGSAALEPAILIGKRLLVRFTLPQGEHISIKLYDASGRNIATLLEGSLEAGHHEVTFDARGTAQGIYFCRVSSLSWEQTCKFSVVN